MKFELNENEEKSYNNFIKKLSKKYLNDVEIIFSNGGGIGRCVKVKAGKHEKDITDYSSW